MSATRYALVVLGLSLATLASAAADAGQPLPGTALLTLEGDIASQLVAGVDRFLLGQTAKALERRARHWQRDLSSAANYHRSLEPNRQRLAHILGVRDPCVPFEALELVGTTAQPALVGRGDGFEIFAVRWPAFGDVHGEGLLLVPTKKPKVADVVAIPDADLLPEQIVGLVGGVPAESQYARRLAESGCRVIVPVLIDRKIEQRGGRAKMSSREFLYRAAFPLGRHPIGYEVQKVLAAVDWFARQRGNKKTPIGVIGWGEGGLLALYAGALDPRIDTACVSGYFGDRQNLWQEPIERNVFGLLEQFGDAELATMIAPRRLIVEACQGPEWTIPPGNGGPGRLTTPKLAVVEAEVQRAAELVKGLQPPGPYCHLIPSGAGSGSFGTDGALQTFLTAIGCRLSALGRKPIADSRQPTADSRQPQARQARQLQEVDRHNQHLLDQSPWVRRDFMKKLDTSSLEKYEQSVQWYRQFFYDEVIGRFEDKLLPFNPRSRQRYETEKWTGYEVVLDVFPDVIAYGILLVPRDLKPGEKRPVVVCQHGLEGRPQHVIGKEVYPVYKAFAAQLAERGFVTFAPQNLYLFKDRFRSLQRMANPLKRTLFSIIVPQHQQITDWLKTLPFVDGQRIGFYGLSYGGVTAMHVPPLVDNYCLSICSANFGDWVNKLASTRTSYSYAWHNEYEIAEFDLGSTFNYAEMAALIAPRPFMVERGHQDGVQLDDTVAAEFAKVRHLYQGRLGLGDRCAIEWFNGGHVINGQGTFDFLHKHLRWPKR